MSAGKDGAGEHSAIRLRLNGFAFRLKHFAAVATLAWGGNAAVGYFDTNMPPTILPWWIAPVAGPPLAALALYLVENWCRANLTLGRDGILVERAFRPPRFVPWRDVLGIARSLPNRQPFFYEERVHLLTREDRIRIGSVKRGGEMTPSLEGQARSFGEGEDLAAFVRSARERASQERVPRCARLIEGKDIGEWLSIFREALKDEGYRASSVRDSLLADLKDPALSPTLRAVIARALRPRVEERGQLLKVRAETASPEVVLALDRQLEQSAR